MDAISGFIEPCYDIIPDCIYYEDRYPYTSIIMTFSALLAFCVGNPPVLVDFHHKISITQNFDVYLNVNQKKNCWTKRRVADYLTRNCGFRVWLVFYCCRRTIGHLISRLSRLCPENSVLNGQPGDPRKWPRRPMVKAYKMHVACNEMKWNDAIMRAKMNTWTLFYLVETIVVRHAL